MQYRAVNIHLIRLYPSDSPKVRVQFSVYQKIAVFPVGRTLKQSHDSVCLIGDRHGANGQFGVKRGFTRLGCQDIAFNRRLDIRNVHIDGHGHGSVRVDGGCKCQVRKSEYGAPVARGYAVHVFLAERHPRPGIPFLNLHEFDPVGFGELVVFLNKGFDFIHGIPFTGAMHFPIERVALIE
jgi:hypothetical protein